ncbi:kunitz-type serine protease inhibitor 4-like [Liasis olivaceus]
MGIGGTRALLLGLLLVSAELPPTRARDRCRLPPDPGPCKARLPKVFYNWQAKRCQGFIYGGCHGNLNRFDSVEMCQLACGGQGKPGVCPQPPPGTITISRCGSDWECNGKQKCCGYASTSACTDPV